MGFFAPKKTDDGPKGLLSTQQKRTVTMTKTDEEDAVLNTAIVRSLSTDKLQEELDLQKAIRSSQNLDDDVIFGNVRGCYQY